MTDRDVLSLLDWRRRIAEVYAEVRALLAREPVAAHEHWARERDRMFAAHPQSPLPEEARAGFQGLALFGYDPQFAFTAHIDLDDEPEPALIGGSTGESFGFLKIGAVDLPIGRLDVYWLDAYGGGLYLPFRDATAGEQTYGAGRYLLDTVKGADLGSAADGALTLDFNFAYHPSCAYSPEWSCPLAPPGNRTDVAVLAGERMGLPSEFPPTGSRTP